MTLLVFIVLIVAGSIMAGILLVSVIILMIRANNKRNGNPVD
jgi:hypothetical protein